MTPPRGHVRNLHTGLHTLFPHQICRREGETMVYNPFLLHEDSLMWENPLEHVQNGGLEHPFPHQICRREGRTVVWNTFSLIKLSS
jgi:hypothetical protein